MNILTAAPRGLIQAGSSRTGSGRTARLLNVVVGVTGSAALLAWVMVGIFHLGQDAVVVTVMTVAFMASWKVTNRRPSIGHRLTLVPARVRSY